MRSQQGEKKQYGVAMMAANNFSKEIAAQLRYTVGVEIENARSADFLQALSLALRLRLTRIMLETEQRRQITQPKRICYLSMEFLIGRSLQNNLLNLGLQGEATAALDELECSLDGIAALEHDAALGNGGLGRLAACFIDSMATLDLAGFGCGIRYDFGLFKQEVLDGRQREKPDFWNAGASPWLIERVGEAHQIPLYGRIEHGRDAQGRYNPMWLDWHSITSLPYDMPIAGSGGRTVNYLRLYAARASKSFDIEIFNSVDYVPAVQQKIASENISKVLYPSDAFYAGKVLQLIQEYFLVASSLRDVVRQFLKEGLPFFRFATAAVVESGFCIRFWLRLLAPVHAEPHLWQCRRQSLPCSATGRQSDALRAGNAHARIQVSIAAVARTGVHGRKDGRSGMHGGTQLNAEVQRSGHRADSIRQGGRDARLPLFIASLVVHQGHSLCVSRRGAAPALGSGADLRVRLLRLASRHVLHPVQQLFPQWRLARRQPGAAVVRELVTRAGP